MGFTTESSKARLTHKKFPEHNFCRDSGRVQAPGGGAQPKLGGKWAGFCLGRKGRRARVKMTFGLPICTPTPTVPKGSSLTYVPLLRQ